jgi:hypothetical protein
MWDLWKKWQLDRLCFRVLLFFAVSIIPPWLFMLICRVGMNNTPVGGRSSDMNNNNNKSDKILQHLFATSKDNLSK